MKDTTTEILERILQATNLSSASDLARELGISPQAVSKAIKNGKVPPRWLRTLGGKRINIQWIDTGLGSMYFDENTKNQITPSILNELIMIPMVEARLSAGGGSLETSAEYECLYPFKRDFIERKGNPKDMVLMRVAGDSMQPEIQDNDMVLIDQSKTEIMPSRIFAVGFEDYIYLKRIDVLPGKVVLKSVNPEYPPVELDIQEDMTSLFRVIGKVLWSGREYL